MPAGGSSANPAGVAEVAELPAYPGIAFDRISLVSNEAQASAAVDELMSADAIGFDTESKPTFRKGETSDGPHLVQLATDAHAYLFPVSGVAYAEALGRALASPSILKVGFGLRDDLRHLHNKLGIEMVHVLDLAITLREVKRSDVGAKTAVARFFGQKLQKSKKISTSNWASPRLNERQMLYAANDAHVALKIYREWVRRGGVLHDAPGLR